MQIFEKVVSIREELRQNRAKGNQIGFVATMGALHEGHLSLIRRAKEENELVVCSIFVNPKQFNNPVDLEKYPRLPEQDAELLRAEGCDLLFHPSVEEMYPKETQDHFEFGRVAEVMEAVHRPGHFDGMATVVKRFFEILEPDRAYFGEKDYQQLAIVRLMAKQFNLPVEVIGGETVREASGLAMSSRNLRLPEASREKAVLIYQTMQFAKAQLFKMPMDELLRQCRQKLDAQMDLEYFEIADEVTFEAAQQVEEGHRLRVFVAAQLASVRLIDNLSLNA